MLARHTEDKETEFVIIDNDSDEGGQHLKDAIGSIGLDLKELKRFSDLKIISKDKNVGNYPIFNQMLMFATGDVLAFFHSDLFVHESGWDRKVKEAFEQKADLGLVGFIGSNEIDSLGGRGMGTMSNFQGHTIKDWHGSAAEVHGRRVTDLQPAAVVDGCAMIFRRKALFDIGFRPDFPIHHFYDRLMCCEVLEHGYKVGVLGIACDHASGQTANTQPKYFGQAEEWFKSRGVETFQQWVEKNRDWFGHNGNSSKGQTPGNWDHCMYLEAEKQFMLEYRYSKNFVPVRVNADWTVRHL